MNKGENPMRWNCETQGCFNLKKRPKIEVFAECFPGRINFGDVDGLVELNNQFLLLEWKPSTIQLGTGQRLTYERITAGSSFVVFLVAGNAETMQVVAFAKYVDGRFFSWQACDLDGLKAKLRAWVRFVTGKKGVARPHA